MSFVEMKIGDLRWGDEEFTGEKIDYEQTYGATLLPEVCCFDRPADQHIAAIISLSKPGLDLSSLLRSTSIFISTSIVFASIIGVFDLDNHLWRDSQGNVSMMNQSRSAHMADVKGKGIFYEDDDEPIQLTNQGDSLTIHDYRLSLIGKILNPKKQYVVKLIQTMPGQ
ncbi:hypothetical protein YC2023_084117 [Brassica napus]